MDWGIGLTLCRRSTFLWTTALGILPGAVLFLLSGEGVARLYARHPILAVAVGIAALVLIVVVAYRRPIMNKHS